jgi:hypothetical protein
LIAESEFADWVFWITNCGRGLMAVFGAYFDRSRQSIGKSKYGIEAVAGFVFSPDNARAFERGWVPMFEEYGGMHMKDLVSGRRGFKDITPEKRDALFKQFVPLIGKLAERGLIVMCIDDWAKKHRGEFPGYQTPYSMCCFHAVLDCARWAPNSHTIAHVFEAGDPGRWDVENFFFRVNRHHRMKKLFRLSSNVEFKTRKEAPLLGAADFLAYESARMMRRTSLYRALDVPGGLPFRKSFKEILASRKIGAVFLDPETMENGRRITSAVGRSLVAAKIRNLIAQGWR